MIVVQSSLALAFSLAGIVAGVRFRSTLDDTRDAVYIFLAIGTASAAGAQALGIAFATSLIFNERPPSAKQVWRRLGNVPLQVPWTPDRAESWWLEHLPGDTEQVSP